MRTPLPRILALSAIGACAATALCVWAGSATAVSTRSFLLDDSASLAAGELDGTAVLSTGAVVPGVEIRRMPVDDVPIAWSMVSGRDAIYIGTGNEGKIYRLRGDSLEVFAETGQLLVSAMALADDGTLFAGTLPEGRIYTVSPQGQVAELARPDGAEHIWALVWDSTRSRLFAATGPDGKIFAIDRQGHSDVFWDSNASHVMALDVDSDGAVYAGTDGDAVLVRLRAPGRAEVVYDFPGNEITAIDARDGTVAVAANEFPDPPASSSATKTKASGRASRPSPGKGKLWRVAADGRAQQVLAADDSHFTCVELAADGTIYAGTGKEGRIHRVNPDSTSAMWIDVDERQVLAIDLDSASPAFVTGDTAAIYRVVGAPARNAVWTSKALDAQFVSRFGLLRWRGTGAVQFQTRSGNRAEPDESWSEWSTLAAAPTPIRSPAARFLQVRARFPEGGSDAQIFAVVAYYLPQNQRAQLSEVTIEPANATKTKEGTSPDRVREPSPRYKLKWKIENPDSDDMRYRLRYRSETQTIWRDMFRESEELTTNEYTWDTAALPDGWYLIEVRGTDAPSNPAGLALEAVVQSEPLLIDNHPPRLDGLRAAGTRVSGRALDDLGPIARLEYAVDGGEWHVFFPADDLLDSGDERFDVDVGTLAAGSHIVAVRVTDSGGNTVTDETTIAVR
jgi:outer membrane protein assembly factor BamB